MKKQLLFEFKQLKKLKAFSLFALVFMATINVSHAQLNTWVGGTSTDFLDATNWSTAAPPATFLAGTTFSIGVGSPNNPILSTNYPGTTSGGLTVTPTGVLTTNGNMNLGGSTSYTYIDGQLTVTGGNFNGRGNLYIANSASATAAVINIQTGGTVNVKNVAYVGRTKSGTLNLNGGTFSSENQATGGLIVGTASSTAAGVININSGLVKINKVAGFTINTYGTVNIDAGSIVLAGDQTVTIATYIGNSKIKLFGAALSAGKTISNTFDSVTNLTTVITTNTTTWTGTVWSNGTPTSTLEAIIDGTYNGVAFNAKKLTINSGKSLTITSGNLTIQNEVANNGTMVIGNNANLIQVAGTTNTNTGNIVINRNSSPLLRLDYTLWSSPVEGQNLVAFSPLTSQSPSRFYNYDTATNLYNTIADPTTTSFGLGTGCLIRMPNTADAVTPTAYAGQFTGVPNNGDIPVTMVDGGAGLRFNLVGNPYPSPITISTFVTDNANITGTLYFWRKTNGVGTAYCTWTGGVFTTNGNAQSVDPAGVIQTGQGFFVEANGSGTTLIFKNGQKAANTTGQFFKTKQVATSDKIWLNATNAAGDFSQMAVNYTNGATQGVDAFDGKYINDSPLALTSNINNDEYTIQGRPAFDASDVVPLNFKTAVAGDYTIAIDHSEGVFAAGQSVILTDATTGTETDLTKSAYTFTAATGTASSRFSLKYQKTLGTNKAVLNDNNVIVYKSKGTLYVNAGDVTIANIKVYDVQGKLVAELKNVKATSETIANLKATNQVLVVKITSQDNKVVTKKVVN